MRFRSIRSPASYLVGFSWVGLDGALVAAFVSFGAARITEDGTSSSAIRVLYNLFPDAIQWIDQKRMRPGDS